MVGMRVLGDSLVVNKVFVISQGKRELEPAEFMDWEWLVYGWPWKGYWLNLFLAEDSNKDAKDVSGEQQS